MNRSKNILLILSSGGMMLCCFFACTSFIFASISQEPFPLPDAAAILFLATALTRIHHQQGWRRIYVGLLHISGFLCSALWLCHRYYKLKLPFWRPGWVPEFYLAERAIAGWLTLVLIFLCVALLWACGIRLLTKMTEQKIISRRFDLGLAVLFVLLLIKLVIVVKSGSVPKELSSTGPTLFFIILGLFSMGLVRTKSASQQEGASYIKGTGIVLSFMFITLMLGGGLFSLFLPKMQSLAQTSPDLFGTLKNAISNIMDAWFNFSSGSQMLRKGTAIINRSGGDLGVLHFLFIGFASMILLSVGGLIFVFLLKWLFSALKWLFSKLTWLFIKTEEENEELRIWKILFFFICSIRNLFATVWLNILSNMDTSRTAEYVFKLLLRWGRFSGLKHGVSETPKEYGIRLADRFPQLEKEIGLIIHLHDEAVYGFRFPDSDQISRMKLAMRKIRSPLLWLTRLKSLCFQNRI